MLQRKRNYAGKLGDGTTYNGLIMKKEKNIL